MNLRCSASKFYSVGACLLFLILATTVFSQKIAILAPENLPLETHLAEKLSEKLAGKFQISDEDLSKTVLGGYEFENPYNLSLEESRNLGAAIGCQYFLLIKSATTRRELLDKPAYYESYAAVFLVSSRSGKLVSWQLKSFPAAAPEKSEKLLFGSISAVGKNIGEQILINEKLSPRENHREKIEEIPEENSSEARNFHAPIPYKRIKPEYPATAFLYGVRATVDAIVEIGADGAVLRAETARWAGFGLDESVIQTIRKMNWRPAMRDGKPLPMRVLLRYNFKKVEKSE